MQQIPDQLVHWAGIIKLPVKAQAARPAWEQKMLMKAIQNGEGASKELRYACRIAQDSNAAFGVIKVRRPLTGEIEEFTIDPHSKAQFGRNQKGLPFLTLGLASQDTDDKYLVQWQGDGIPLKMKQLAVQHDEGKKAKACIIAMDLADARITLKGKHAPSSPAPPRVPGAKKREYKSNRLCRSDLDQGSR